MDAWIISGALNGLGLVANWCYGNKSKYGPLLWIAAALGWIIYFLISGQPSLCIGPGLNLGSQVRNLVKYCNPAEVESPESVQQASLAFDLLGQAFFVQVG